MISSSRPRRPLGVALAVIVLLSAAACTGDHKKAAATSSSPTPTSTSASPTITPKPAVVAKNPFTGLGPVPKHPVIAVKVDDTAPGRPQVGIDKADIVYIEEAEGGLTRLAAIYGTTMPKVGYVRSTRPSDPDLFLQFGKITEAYSGGAHDSLPRVRRSGITSWSNDAGAPFYVRAVRSESSYINLVLDLAKVAKATKTTRPKSMGWKFAAALTGLGATSAGTDVRTVVGGTPVEFKYNSKTHKYVRYIDGTRQMAADGKPVATTNVIVQSCRIVAHPEDTDVDGNPSQFTYTIGKGAVSVFRGGRRIDGTWTRQSPLRGTYLHTKTGANLNLAPGNSWVVLVHTGTRTRG